MMSVVSHVFFKRLNLMIQCAAGISRSPSSGKKSFILLSFAGFSFLPYQSFDSSSSLLSPVTFTVPGGVLLHCNHISRSFVTALSQHAVRLTPKRLVFFLVTCKLKNADSVRVGGAGTCFCNCISLTVFVDMLLHRNVWGKMRHGHLQSATLCGLDPVKDYFATFYFFILIFYFISESQKGE